MTANKNEAVGNLRTRMFEVDHVLQREQSRLNALEEGLRARVDEGAALEEKIFQMEARVSARDPATMHGGRRPADTRDPHWEGSDSRGHSIVTKVAKKVSF
jgi:hypothetical protein